jgi:hypothetical protein
VTILIRLILYITCIDSIISPLQLLSSLFRAIAGGFSVLFHIGIWSPSTRHPHSFTPPSTNSPPIQCTYFTVLSFLLIFKLVFKGVSQCMPTVGVLCFGSFNLFHYSSLSLYLPLLIFQQLSKQLMWFHTLRSFSLFYF